MTAISSHRQEYEVQAHVAARLANTVCAERELERCDWSTNNNIVTLERMRQG